ncbi:MAG: ribbon-helix-helix protein, CopG family [Actinomycetota bacterium]
MTDTPAGIDWLEQSTGQNLSRPDTPSEAGDRHLSVRLPPELSAGLDALAAEFNTTASQVVRDLLAEAIGRRQEIADLDASELADRLAADVAEVRRRLAG